MSASDVIKKISDEDIQFVDFRFTDTKGKEQHVSVPASTVEESVFESGKMFDGSSIAGWKGINESDMIIMPDANTAVVDPFFSDSTMILRCDILEPATMEGYGRDPRSVAKRAEAYLSSTGIAGTAYFGPEPEFFVFDDVKWGNDMSGAFYKTDSDESAWNSGKHFEDGNIGHRPCVRC
jgi:glutamine synthetase